MLWLCLYLDVKIFWGEAVDDVTEMDDDLCEREADDVWIAKTADGR